jgi:hypothetical protein
MLATNETVATRRKREDESEGKRTRANVGIKIGAIANLVPLMANLVPLLTRYQTRTRKFTSLVKSSVFNRELVNATVRTKDRHGTAVINRNIVRRIPKHPFRLFGSVTFVGSKSPPIFN